MKLFLKGLIGSLLLTSCAHTFMRGTVAMKIDKDTAHVCLGNNDVEIGEKVVFLKNECTNTGGSISSTVKKGGARGEDSTSGSSSTTSEVECKMVKLGEGTVTKLLNSHYSEVKVSSDFKFSESTIIQKKTKI